jgi:Skp family chaperone for outer membrane proteins
MHAALARRERNRGRRLPERGEKNVKRIIRIVAGVVALSVVLCLGVKLGAQGTGTQTQTQTQPTASRGNKVAVINLAKVINNYDKWKAFKDEYKKEYDRVFESRVAPIRPNYESLKKQLEDPKTLPDQKETATRELKKLEFQIQTIADEAKAVLGKKESDQFVQLYREVRDAVKACAEWYSIDVVMHYNDAFDPKDLDTPQNVARKMGQACCMPLYVSHECDLSDVVTNYLNKYNRPASAVTPASATGTGTGTGGAATGKQQ